MILILHKKHIAGAALLCAVLLGMSAILWHGREEAAVFSAAKTAAPAVVVIDPGHGGEDGGAVAGDGTVESGVNLAVALRLEEVLAFVGQDTAMTRSEDVSIYSDGAKTLHEKKVSDLKNRVALINGTAGATLVSIHQNTLPGAPSVHGAQVFYNGAAGAQAMAEAVQDSLNQAVNQGGGKSCKKISDSIYLMKHVTVPAILIECGFLSNPEEAALLQTNAYQTRLAVAVAAGVLRSGDAPVTSPVT